MRRRRRLWPLRLRSAAQAAAWWAQRWGDEALRGHGNEAQGGQAMVTHGENVVDVDLVLFTTWNLKRLAFYGSTHRKNKLDIRVEAS